MEAALAGFGGSTPLLKLGVSAPGCRGVSMGYISEEKAVFVRVLQNFSRSASSKTGSHGFRAFSVEISMSARKLRRVSV